MQQQQSRAERYLARVDAHLDGLPFGSERAKFLAGQLDGWEERYCEFARTDGKSEAADVTAADFVLTLSGLASRLEEARRG